MLKAFLRTMKDDTSGATAVEYGLIMSLIILAMLTGMQAVASETIEMWKYVETNALGAMGA
jgi:pilus assembly protein Flp/PilA